MKYLYLIFLITYYSLANALIGVKPANPYTNIIGNYVDATHAIYTNQYLDICGNPILTCVSTNAADRNVANAYKQFTADNVLICYRKNNQQSLYVAKLATNLWQGGQLFEIDNQHMTTGTDHWGTATCDYFDSFTSLETLSNDYVAPIVAHLNDHPEIKYIANSYRMPYKDEPSPPDTESLIYRFYQFSGIPQPQTNNNSVKLFNLGCRTFDDTTNLIQYTAIFDPFINNGYLVQDDYATNLHGAFPVGNYLHGISGHVLYSSNTNKYLTTAPAPINYLLHNGFWMGTRDDHLISTTRFETYPNSVVMSIESYNMKSYRKGTIRFHQTRLYDAFDKNCNGGNYNKIFGCAIGHTMEPGWLQWDVNKFWKLALQGYSYVDCFYYAGNGLPVSTIVCGNPFLRLTP